MGRSAKAPNTNGDNTVTDAGYAPVSMLQGLDQHVLSGGDESSRTAQAALATPLQASSYPEPGSFDALPTSGGFEDGTPSAQALATAQQMYGTPQSGSKPVVGTDEWHQQRKNNHKEGKKKNSSI